MPNAIMDAPAGRCIFKEKQEREIPVELRTSLPGFNPLEEIVQENQPVDQVRRTIAALRQRLPEDI